MVYVHISMDELYRDIASNAMKEIEKCCIEELRGYKDIEFKVLKGVPHEEILKFAEENKIDMIIMGTHSRKGLDRVIFGSTAERVVRHALKCSQWGCAEGRKGSREYLFLQNTMRVYL
jgi:nucleotide-binding universal stress UspA family protein